MQASMIHLKLKQHFPFSLQNINHNNLPTNITQYLDKIVNNNLPHLPLEQLHSICRKQEKHVMNNLIQIKNVDIYQQIANVCPMHKNLKQLSNEEVSRKITHYNNLSIKEYHEQEFNSECMMDLQDGQSQIDQMQMNEICIKRQNHELRNIFEDEDQNQNNLWEDNQIYCLHQNN